MNKITTQRISKRKIVIFILFSSAIVSAIKQYLISNHNNYLIFKNVFYNTIEQKSLYACYPNLYLDHNHYGPVFSLFIAPFAVLIREDSFNLWLLGNKGSALCSVLPQIG